MQPSPRASGPPPYFEVNGDATGYYVIPSDVQPQLRADALDRELFDVRELAREGLDDRSGRGIPVIATYSGRAHAFEVVASHHSQASSLPVTVTGVALSYDDGATWRPVLALPRGHGSYLVTAVQPRTGSVSIRVTAADSAGNRVEQEVIGAYRLA